MKLCSASSSLWALGITTASTIITSLLFRSTTAFATTNASAAFSVAASGKISSLESSNASSSNLLTRNMSSNSSNGDTTNTGTGSPSSIDPDYPGTAVERMLNARARVIELANDPSKPLEQAWPDVRRKLLWAGGLRDLPDSIPGQGYTGHSFNDFNHVDLTTMRMDVSDNNNEGRVAGIAYNNPLGNGIRIASLPELGPGGSWSTCMMGCQKEPPSDVAHVQFQSRIAFKLVWVPPSFTEFVLVDDSGDLLAIGKPSGTTLPALRERQMNYQIVRGSKYAKQADMLGHLMSRKQES